MKYSILALALLGALTACGKNDSPADKVKAQTSKVHALNDSERPLADANAKAFFERQWINADNQKGQFISCRPSDSNFNGLVSCTGLVPQPKGGYAEVKRYCGYRPELVGCSDEDIVK